MQRGVEMRKTGFLVISLCLGVVSGTLAAKERHGADMILAMTNGRAVKGELIAVKKDSLVLLTSSFRLAESIYISEVRSIKIAKKSNAGNGAIIGFLVGGVTGALLGSEIGKYRGGLLNFSTASTIGGGALGGLVGAGGGLLIGSHIKEWELYNIERESPEGIKMILDRLRQKARVADFR